MTFARYRLARGVVMLFLVGTTSVSAQEREISCDNVPIAVHAAFAQAYPQATIRGCAKEVEEGETVYEIASMEGGTGRDVLFHADGRVIVVEETIAVGDAPNPVQQAVHKMYPHGTITLAEKIMRDATLLYEFHVKNDDTLEEIVFDASGAEVEHKSGTEVEQ
jgi:hypothetical protein